MLRVGLTGNIASGKSVAASMFARLGAMVIDADAVSHELLAPGSETAQKVVEAFGPDILDSRGAVDRKKLGRLVFSDPEKRRLLNSLMHPAIREEIRRRMESAREESPRGIVIVDAALMIETGNHRMYDRLIVVTCRPELQVTRIMSRDGLSEAEARARMEAQMPPEEKVKLADYVIDTSGTIDVTREQVEAIYRDLQIQEARVRAEGR